MSCFYVSARLRVCSSCALSCLRALCRVVGALCGLEFAQLCPLLSTCFVLHAVRVLSAVCFYVMACAVWHAACVFHWLRAFMLSYLV